MLGVEPGFRVLPAAHLAETGRDFADPALASPLLEPADGLNDRPDDDPVQEAEGYVVDSAGFLASNTSIIPTPPGQRDGRSLGRGTSCL